MLKKHTVAFLLLLCALFAFFGVTKPAEAKGPYLEIISAEPHQNFVTFKYISDRDGVVNYVLSVKDGSSSRYKDYKKGELKVKKGATHTQKVGCGPCGSKRELKPGADVRVRVGSLESTVTVEAEEPVKKPYDFNDTSEENPVVKPSTGSSQKHTSYLSPWPPKRMTVTPEKILRERTDVEVAFDKGYVPAQGDVLLVKALDQDGNEVDTENIPLDRAVFPVTLTLSPKAAVFSYEFHYQGAEGNESELSDTVLVSGKATDADPSEGPGLRLSYGSLKVKAGAYVAAPKISMIDEAGNAMPVKKAAIAIAGDALEAGSAQPDGSFKVKEDAKVGTTIAVTAVSGEEHASVLFTVVEADGAATLATPERVALNMETDVRLQMQEEGNAIALGWKPEKVAVSVSGALADVSVVDMEKLESEGVLIIRLKGKEEGKAQIDVALTDAEGNVTMLEPAQVVLVSSAIPPAEKRNVTMHINKIEMHVDGKVVKMDTMPIVLDNRTFVPFRSLAQAFGASVDYDDKTRSVSTTLGDKTILMTIGQEKYEQNGEEKVMDVAPFIDQNNRTMVPVRFIAQSLGFSVTPIYDANGITQSVLFGNNAERHAA